jgi:uncharacterized lipoprotein
MRKLAGLSAVALSGVSVLIAGCFGRDSLNCADPSIYSSSTSVAPVRVPDGLDVPDESDALQIPPGETRIVVDADALTECLESPPDFFEEEEDSDNGAPQ